MNRYRKIELLAPARNVECGIEAINHGADAVYMGALHFGARAAAANSLDDVRRLVQYAHLFRARVYITVNTILKDEELPQVEKLIWELYHIGVDALIVQDFSLLRLKLPPIPFHASTQMDNRTPEKVQFLQEQGYKQVVLARELMLDEIQKIHEAVPEMSLEVFVHGALCVSYSGQCYASEYCFHRSANRGECAQFCRLPFDLLDADGKVVEHDKHLLSLRDMNQSRNLEKLLDAGVSSFKIEGRLKDVDYVKNTTAFYRKQLDAIFSRRPEYRRCSSGISALSFTPELSKSFNRGFTDYFLFGRQPDIWSWDSPKSLGEEMGYVKEVRGNCLVVSGIHHFHNGDGACYLDENGYLQGFRVNRVEQNRLYLQEKLPIRPRTVLFRNFDQEFDRQLNKRSAVRKLKVGVRLSEIPDGFLLTLNDEDDCRVHLPLRRKKELARSSQIENLRTQLSKLGNTPFEVGEVEVEFSQNYFIPSSVLAEFRRDAVDKLLQLRRINYPRELVVPAYRHPVESTYFNGQHLSYLCNAYNTEAVAYYKEQGALMVDPAFEQTRVEQVPLMFTRYCIRHALGYCPVYQKRKSPFREPYFLLSKDGRRFRLEFDCKHCQMKVYAAE